MKKMNDISAYDRQRIKHINTLMDEINEQSSGIYEGLVDRDYIQLKESLDSLEIIINEMKKSIQDEI
jgi:hypothetical protein